MRSAVCRNPESLLNHVTTTDRPLNEDTGANFLQLAYCWPMLETNAAFYELGLRAKSLDE